MLFCWFFLGTVLPCVDSNPCQNGGTCVPVGTTATCVCNTCMYTGTFCETGEKEWVNDILLLLSALTHVFSLTNKKCFKYIRDYHHVHNSHSGLKDVCSAEIDFSSAVFVKFNVNIYTHRSDINIYIKWREILFIRNIKNSMMKSAFLNFF